MRGRWEGPVWLSPATWVITASCGGGVVISVVSDAKVLKHMSQHACACSRASASVCAWVGSGGDGGRRDVCRQIRTDGVDGAYDGVVGQGWILAEAVAALEGVADLAGKGDRGMAGRVGLVRGLRGGTGAMDAAMVLWRIRDLLRAGIRSADLSKGGAGGIETAGGRGQDRCGRVNIRGHGGRAIADAVCFSHLEIVVWLQLFLNSGNHESGGEVIDRRDCAAARYFTLTNRIFRADTTFRALAAALGVVRSGLGIRVVNVAVGGVGIAIIVRDVPSSAPSDG